MLAKEAATQQNGMRINALRSQRHAGMHWPTALSQNADGTSTWRPLRDLHADLRNATSAHARLGGSNVSSIYYTSLCKVKPLVNTKVSTHYMGPSCSKHIRHAAKRTSFLFKAGCIYNRKLAKRFGQSHSSACPLCGEEDGGMHIASGCKHPMMNKMVIERHHAAGRLIMKAISKGAKGNNICFMDVGSTDKLATARVDTQQQRELPQEIGELITRHCTTTNNSTYRRSVPDAVLISNWEDWPQEKRSDIILLEIKYCRDTDPGPQRDRALKQHQALLQHLQAHGYNKARIVPILLGVSGTIYSDLKQTLIEDMGLAYASADKLMLKLHAHAINSLHNIVVTRRQLEYNHNSFQHEGGG